MALAVAARVMDRYQNVVAAPAGPFTFFDRSDGLTPMARREHILTDTEFMGRRPTSTLEGWPPKVIEDWLTDT